MKAAKYYGERNVKLISIPKPVITREQVLVKVVCCGICETDVLAYSKSDIFDWELILGHEVVGIVDQVGDGVNNISVGDRVIIGPPGGCGNCYACNTGHSNTCRNAFSNTIGLGPGTEGGYAEYVVSKYPQNEIIKIPDGVTFEQAVLFDVTGAGFHAVRKSALRLGDCVAVYGCNSMGLGVIQSAKLAGASKIVAFDGKSYLREQAKTAGADYVFDIDEQSVEDAYELFEETEGAQVCFDAVGAGTSIEACVSLCMPNGQIMIVGSDISAYPMKSMNLVPHEYDIKFSFTYTKEEIKVILYMMETGKLRTEIFKVVHEPLERCVEILEKLSQREITASRVILIPEGMEKFI